MKINPQRWNFSTPQAGTSRPWPEGPGVPGSTIHYGRKFHTRRIDFTDAKPSPILLYIEYNDVVQVPQLPLVCWNNTTPCRNHWFGSWWAPWGAGPWGGSWTGSWQFLDLLPNPPRVAIVKLRCRGPRFEWKFSLKINPRPKAGLNCENWNVPKGKSGGAA